MQLSNESITGMLFADDFVGVNDLRKKMSCSEALL